MAYNFFPAFRGSGGRIIYIEGDWSRIRIKVPLSWRTRNYVGTIYGGSMYSAVDPFYMVMLIKMLGPDYIVWDKAAEIKFLKPGRSTLYGEFYISPAELVDIKAAADNGKIEREFSIQLVDKDGVIHAVCSKLLSIRRKGDT